MVKNVYRQGSYILLLFCGRVLLLWSHTVAIVIVLSNEGGADNGQ